MEFRFEAVDGNGRVTNGTMEANSENDLLRLLSRQNLTAISVSRAEGSRKPAAKRKKANTQSKAIVIRELATLLRAGVPLAEAVESIASTHLQDDIGSDFSKVHNLLKSGESFSSALSKSELKLPDYLFQLASAGELTGKLTEALESAANQMDYEERVKQEMRNALIYPAILVFSGIGATLLIFIVVVPKFANMLKSNKADIPALSKWVLELGLFVNQNLLLLGMSAAAIVFGIVAMLGNPAARARIIESLSRLPVAGAWLIEIEIGKWATLLSTLLENRVPIVKSMELAQKGVRLGALQSKLQQTLKDVRAGKKLADALASGNVLDLTGLNLVRVGERTSELASMLRTLATLYENSTRERLKRFLILLEPIAILLIGSVIGIIMVAIMLAVTSLSNIPH